MYESIEKIIKRTCHELMIPKGATNALRKERRVLPPTESNAGHHIRKILNKIQKISNQQMTSSVKDELTEQKKNLRVYRKKKNNNEKKKMEADKLREIQTKFPSSNGRIACHLKTVMTCG